MSSKLRSWYAVLVSALSMILSFTLLPLVFGLPDVYEAVYLGEWIPSIGGADSIKFGVFIDPLSVFMVSIASALGTMILLYSTEYMRKEEGQDRYYFLMLLFIGAMLGFVLSENLLIGFFFWEIMGFCSYALIGFWKNEDYNVHCGTKAFIVTRIGDVFLLAGILLIYSLTPNHTLSLFYLSTQSGWLFMLSQAGLLVPIALFMFMGAIGKSAQFPLDVWLPEAMAGPSSVSALIHAATMVKAGVYLTARLLLLFLPWLGLMKMFFVIVALIGGFTAFYTGTMAMVAREIKQVLAFSTISQLGYMMLAIGVGGIMVQFEGAYFAGIFQLLNHAAFKALLFLAAGGVLHATERKDMFEMGGLRSAMPKTFAAMLIGALALSGFPPFSGFWSKDTIIIYTWGLITIDPITGSVLFGFGVASVATTFFYSLRMIGLTFLGNKSKHIKELEKEGHKIHDPGWAMMTPVMVLGTFSIIGGFLGPLIDNFFGQSEYTYAGVLSELTSAPSLIIFGALALGGIPAYLLYIRRSSDPIRLSSKPLIKGIHKLLVNRWYGNSFYYRILNGFIAFSNKLFRRGEISGLEGLNLRVPKAFVRFSGGIRKVDERVVDRAANEIAKGTVSISKSSSKIQTGRVSDYISAFFFGLVMLLVAVLMTVGVV
nr:NADH-quinone oxidoreductase subunit L [Candidatus Njordarchaeota archaeon]